MNCQKKLIKIHNYKNIFLDRDGVINEVVIRDNLLSSPRNISEFRFRNDFLDFIENVDIEKDIFVVTNQPDIKRGLLKNDDLLTMHQIISSSFTIKEIVFCPHNDEDKCKCRKPLPGMINQIINKYNLTRNDCCLIGDSHKDMLAAKSAKVDAILLKTRYNKPLEGFPLIERLAELL